MNANNVNANNVNANNVNANNVNANNVNANNVNANNVNANNVNNSVSTGLPCIRIRGGNRLNGVIAVSGAKNAALPILTASLMTDAPLSLSNLPPLTDIDSLLVLLRHHGAEIEPLPGNVDTESGNGNTALRITCSDITDITAPYDLVRKMRASILVLGPLLARCGEAKISRPGGCAIGARPVDLHLRGLAQMGAGIDLEGGYIIARAPNGLHGERIVFPSVSVGATENLLLAATVAKGETLLVNAAREPEVSNLAHCLVAMGAKIDGIGTDTLTVSGVDRLGGATHAVMPDRIEAGTYATAAAITGGEVLLRNADLTLLNGFEGALRAAGVVLREESDGLRVTAVPEELVGIDVTTEPYPGFPTDLQAQFMALMTIAQGSSGITETIFENRFMHVPEFQRMGADITLSGTSAFVRGVVGLRAAPVMATDLRASVSLVLAGLVAEGETVIHRIYHLDRGYARIEEKLGACGAAIERIAAP